MENNNSLKKISELTGMLLRSNLLWFIFSSPFLVVVYFMIHESNRDINFLHVIVLIVLSSFFLFPSITALFAVVRKYVMGEEIVLIESFFKFFKENYKRSWTNGLFFSSVCALFLYVYLIFYDYSLLTNLLLYIFAVIISVFIFHFACMTVHMEINLFTTYRNALVLTIGGNILTIILGIVNLVLIYVSVKLIPLLIVFITGSIIAYINFTAFYRMMFSVLYYKEKDKEKETIEENHN